MKYALYKSSEEGNLQAVKTLIAAKSPMGRVTDFETPLSVACQNGHLACALALLEAGAKFDDHNDEGEASAHFAMKKDNVDCLRLLLDRGFKFDDESDGGGFVHAAESDAVQCLEELARRGGDPRTSKGCWEEETTPLLAACTNGSARAAAWLCSHGVDVDAEDADGLTPLIAACTNGSVECCRVVLQHGAGPDGNDSDGTPALLCALQRTSSSYVPLAGSVGCANLLLDYGARLPALSGDATEALPLELALSAYDGCHSKEDGASVDKLVARLLMHTGRG